MDVVAFCDSARILRRANKIWELFLLHPGVQSRDCGAFTVYRRLQESVDCIGRNRQRPGALVATHESAASLLSEARQ